MKAQSVPRSKHTPSRLHETNQLMLYRQIIAVCSAIHTEHTHTLCGQNVASIRHVWKIAKKETISFFMPRIGFHKTDYHKIWYTIQISHQPDAAVFQFIILTFVYSSTCFGRFTANHQDLNHCSDSLWFYLRIVVTVALCSWPAGRSDHEHGTTATAVIELLMMGGKTPETCWAVNKRQDNKLKNSFIRLAIYLNCTMMHGLTNLNIDMPYLGIFRKSV